MCLALIPAYAGSTRVWWPGARGEAAHPRLRGEHTNSSRRAARFSGSSPLTRGARVLASPAVLAPGLIPAYAGSTFGRNRSARRDAAHPRLRGEHVLGNLQAPTGMGSSPLTRGALTEFSEV